MPVAPSFADLLAVAKAEAQARRPDLAFNDGDVTDADNHAAAAVGDAVIRFTAQAFRDLFFDGATDDALDALVDDRCNIQRKPATPAQATIAFSRTSGGAGGTIPAGTRIGTDFDPDGSQIVFTTDAPVTFGGADNGPHSVSCTAVNTGSAGNVAATKIAKVLDSLYDKFTVTNAAPAGGGNDKETDEELRKRAKTFFSTLVRGTLAALEQGALTVPSVRIARATEDPSTASVALLVGDSSGNSTLQMQSDVTIALESWRCAGIVVSVIGGTQSVVTMAIRIAQYRRGLDVTALAPLVAQAVAGRINKLALAETLYLDSVVAAAIAVAPDDIYDVTITSIVVDGAAKPIVDIVPPSTGGIINSVLRTVAGNIAVS